MSHEPTQVQNRETELLMPAGSLQKLKMAILYGADAVYLGTPDMSLRTKSQFSLEEVIEGIEYAHQFGKRVYLTLNLFSHNKDIPKLPQYIETVRKVKPDGLIIADPGVFKFVKEHAPEIPLHISTQANVCSWLSTQFWEEQGAELVVLAREVSYPELKEIREKCPNIKLEAFVHGAMCMTYSGRCMLSNYMAERGANQGNCANSCRWKYTVNMRLKDGSTKELYLTEENLKIFEFVLEEGCRPGDFLPIEEDSRGTYILNAKDLCLMPKLNEYLEIGVDSFKVEGRNKSQYYVAIAARAYRMAIDDWKKDPENWDYRPYMKELYTIPNRGYSFAFHEGRLTHLAHNFENTRSLSEYEFAGLIHEVEEDAFIVEVKNKLVAGDVVEFVSPYKKEPVLIRLYSFDLLKDNKVLTVEEVNAGQQPLIRIPFALFDQETASDLKAWFPPMSVLRKDRALLKYETSRIKLDKTAQRLELGKSAMPIYKANQHELISHIDEDSQDRETKSPRLGLEGCCSKGCNGCLMFWHDPTYAKAREKMAQKKQGEMLSSQEVVEAEAEIDA